MSPSEGARVRRSPADGRTVAHQAIMVTCLVYLGYGLLGVVGVAGDIRGLLLVAAFYFVPGWMLRHDRERQTRYQVGPDSPVPTWSWAAAKSAAIACLVVFPLFVIAFFWFYSRVCTGDVSLLSPILWLLDHTPWAGNLDAFLARLCRGHNGRFWPASVAVPETWTLWFGLGAVYQIALEILVVALPEEVFHRGYLMSALEERWPARRRVLGVPFGIAAVLASALFALGHLVGEAEVARLATFFPALAFAWLWRRTGSLWTPALFHAASNVLMAILIASTFR